MGGQANSGPTSEKKNNKEIYSSPTEEEVPNLRYGPMPSFPNQKRFARYVIVFSLMILAYFYPSKDKERVFAAVMMSSGQRTMSLPCSKSLIRELSHYKDCVPHVCGRGVYDSVVSAKEVDILQKLAEKGFSFSTASGGAAILDLHSGALSHDQDFVNIYTINSKGFLSHDDIDAYKSVRKKIQQIIAAQFMINPASLHLTHPTFFSRLTSAPPRTVHDEYWHTHVDKETYPSFHYTALLYLSSFNSDFKGGRFHFVEDDNSTYVIEPKKGRVLLFTSGQENAHRVEPVTSGDRTALTIAFTCDARLAIKDPNPGPNN